MHHIAKNNVFLTQQITDWLKKKIGLVETLPVRHSLKNTDETTPYVGEALPHFPDYKAHQKFFHGKL